MAEKRRLPVVQPRTDEDEASPRPPWQWIGFGAVAIFAAWLPLAYVAQLVGLKLAASKLGPLGGDLSSLAAALEPLSRGERARLWLDILVPQVISLAIASFAGGFLVGRWGRPAGVREAALAGVFVALVASALSCAASGLSLAPLVIALISAPFAAWGARRGRGPKDGRTA